MTMRREARDEFIGATRDLIQKRMDENGVTRQIDTAEWRALRARFARGKVASDSSAGE